MGEDIIEDDKIVYNGNGPRGGRRPAEYVDRLLRMGVRMVVHRPGRWLELEPEIMTRDHQAEAYHLRAFWLATQPRRRRVIAELRRREMTNG